MTIPPLTVPRSVGILAGSRVSSRRCSGRSLDRCLSPQRRTCARPLGFPGIADLPIGSWVSPSSFFLPVAHASRPELRRGMPALFRFPFPITSSAGIPATAPSWVLMVGTAFRGGPPTQFLGYSNTDYSVIPNLPAQPRALLEASNPSPIALAASWVLMVGTAFRGGPPTRFLGYSKTDYSVIPNLPAQPRALLEASNPSPIALAASWVLMVGTAFRGGPPTRFLGYSKTDYSVIPNLPAQPRTLLEASNPSPIASPLPSALSANLCALCGNLFSPSFNASTSKVAP